MYFSLLWGKSYLSSNVVNPNGQIPSVTGISFKPGEVWGFSLGQRGGPIRYESQYLYMFSKVDTIFVNQDGFPAQGHSTTHSWIFNIMYVFFSGHRFEPYLGLGIGLSHLRARVTNTPLVAYHGYPVTGFKIVENEIGYQAIGGFSVSVKDHFALDFTYRYFETTKAGHFGKHYNSNIGNIGVSYHV